MITYQVCDLDKKTTSFHLSVFWCTRKRKKLQKKMQRALELVLSYNVRLTDYDESEVLQFDADTKGKLYTK